MSLRHHARAAVALIAAYAIVLQALLLAVGSPVAEPAGFGAHSLCSAAAAGSSAPARHTSDCAGPCPGCCCNPAAGPAPAPAVAYAPAALAVAPIAIIAPPLVFVSVNSANRSRAPPSA